MFIATSNSGNRQHIPWIQGNFFDFINRVYKMVQYLPILSHLTCVQHIGLQSSAPTFTESCLKHLCCNCAAQMVFTVCSSIQKHVPMEDLQCEELLNVQHSDKVYLVHDLPFLHREVNRFVLPIISGAPRIANRRQLLT